MADNTQQIKYNPQFIQEAENYLKKCQEQKKLPSVQNFAQYLGVDDKSVIAWATKKIKDEQGNPTDQYARPEFLEVVRKIKKLSSPKQKEEVSQPDKPKEEKKKSKKEELKEKILNEKQELFCKLFASEKEFFGNGVESYAEAYDIDISDPKKYKTAATNAYRLLINADILKRIDELLELGPLNDTFVDKQLAKVIAQDADFPSKVSAIREYNKLKQRITDKMDLTSKGERLPSPIYGGKSTSELQS